MNIAWRYMIKRKLSDIPALFSVRTARFIILHTILSAVTATNCVQRLTRNMETARRAWSCCCLRVVLAFETVRVHAKYYKSNHQLLTTLFVDAAFQRTVWNLTCIEACAHVITRLKPPGQRKHSWNRWTVVRYSLTLCHSTADKQADDEDWSGAAHITDIGPASW